MPIVQCYSHPRYHSHLYSLEDKQYYIEDLKLEAFGNLRTRYMQGRYERLLQDLDSRAFSVKEIVAAMNSLKKDVFKTFANDLSMQDFVSAWRGHCWDEDLLIHNYLVGIELWHTSSRRNSDAMCAEISVKIADLGFLWPLFGQGDFQTDLFGGSAGHTVVHYHAPVHGDFGCGELSVYTDEPGLVSWTKDVIDYFNSYKEISGKPHSNHYDETEIFESYGKVSIY